MADNNTSRSGMREGSLPFMASWRTDLGLVRSENQDACDADMERGLFLVCDGMGGERGGAVAAQAVVSMLPALIEERLSALLDCSDQAVARALKDCIADVSVMVRERTRDAPQLAGMGATVVLAQLTGKGACIAHLGDSRAYLFQHGVLERLTQDHTIVAVMLQLGQITPEQARRHPARGQLTRYVGMKGKAVADVRWVALQGGCRLLLCSDGLTAMLNDEEIAELLGAGGSADAACQFLVEQAIRAGGHDNITVIAIDIG